MRGPHTSYPGFLCPFMKMGPASLTLQGQSRTWGRHVTCLPWFLAHGRHLINVCLHLQQDSVDFPYATFDFTCLPSHPQGFEALINGSLLILHFPPVSWWDWEQMSTGIGITSFQMNQPFEVVGKWIYCFLPCKDVDYMQPEENQGGSSPGTKQCWLIKYHTFPL